MTRYYPFIMTNYGANSGDKFGIMTIQTTNESDWQVGIRSQKVDARWESFQIAIRSFWRLMTNWKNCGCAKVGMRVYIYTGALPPLNYWKKCRNFTNWMTATSSYCQLAAMTYISVGRNSKTWKMRGPGRTPIELWSRTLLQIFSILGNVSHRKANKSFGSERHLERTNHLQDF